MRPINLLSNVPLDLPEELIEVICRGRGVRIERIVSRGQASPPGFWYDQPDTEWVILLSGAAQLRFEGNEPLSMKPGDSVEIPAHARHRVEWTDPDQPTIWLAVHFAPPGK